MTVLATVICTTVNYGCGIVQNASLFRQKECTMNL